MRGLYTHNKSLPWWGFEPRFSRLWSQCSTAELSRQCMDPYDPVLLDLVIVIFIDSARSFLWPFYGSVNISASHYQQTESRKAPGLSSNYIIFTHPPITQKAAPPIERSCVWVLVVLPTMSSSHRSYKYQAHVGILLAYQRDHMDLYLQSIISIMYTPVVGRL